MNSVSISGGSSGSQDAGGGGSDELNCHLVDNFALAVQSLMGVIALSTLFIKRHREHPRRPFKIWLMDVTKQGFGGLMLHALNIVASYLSVLRRPSELFSAHPSNDGAGGGDANPCVWYFLNILLDTTVGVYIIYVYFRLIHHIAVKRLGISNMQPGVYGHPPRWTIWLKQSFAFFLALLWMKLTVMLALAIFPFLLRFGQWAMAPVYLFKDTRVQIVIVMFIVPLIMNAVQFWLVDAFLKHKGPMDDANGPYQSLPTTSSTAANSRTGSTVNAARRATSDSLGSGDVQTDVIWHSPLHVDSPSINAADSGTAMNIRKPSTPSSLSSLATIRSRTDSSLLAARTDGGSSSESFSSIQMTNISNSSGSLHSHDSLRDATTLKAAPVPTTTIDMSASTPNVSATTNSPVTKSLKRTDSV